MNRVAIWIAVIGCVFGALLWCSWKLQPWRPTGARTKLHTWQYDGTRFEIWQTKNSTFDEPFSTHLYILSHSNFWVRHYLSHQDLFMPNYAVARSNDVIHLLRNNRLIGSIGLREREYIRSGGGASVEEISTVPPDRM